ncbi:MAG: membrane dipeptidase [Clostridia bacterium]|nr:membrane dipeptidase [Clostridia bacterium]
MRFFDLHCDTLYRMTFENKEIYRNDLHVNLKSAEKIEKYLSCFAIWIPDSVRNMNAEIFFDKAVRKLKEQELLYCDLFDVCKNSKDLENFKNNKCKNSGIILTVEGGAVLNSKLERIKVLKDAGVKILTLTWNGSCEFGDGVLVDNAGGLTEFGIKAVQMLEESSIIVDVSHASEQLFYDVCDYSKKPFIATHSNFKKICNNKRNLTDSQFREIAERGGLVGITFCKKFLSECSEVNYDDVLKHVYHFLELDGEKVVSIGSDFDGAEVPDCLNGIGCVENLYEYFLSKRLSENLVDDIFFNNAYNFATKYF